MVLIDERRKMPTWLFLEKLRDRGNLEDLYVESGIILMMGRAELD